MPTRSQKDTKKHQKDHQERTKNKQRKKHQKTPKNGPVLAWEREARTERRHETTRRENKKIKQERGTHENADEHKGTQRNARNHKYRQGNTTQSLRSFRSLRSLARCARTGERNARDHQGTRESTWGHPERRRTGVKMPATREHQTRQAKGNVWKSRTIKKKREHTGKQGTQGNTRQTKEHKGT